MNAPTKRIRIAGGAFACATALAMAAPGVASAGVGGIFSGSLGSLGSLEQSGPSGYDGNVLHFENSQVVKAGHYAHDIQVTCAGSPADVSAENSDHPASMADGYVAIGGGFRANSRDVTIPTSRQAISIHFPTHGPESTSTGDYSWNGKGWTIDAVNHGNKDVTVHVWVDCIYAPNDDPTD